MTSYRSLDDKRRQIHLRVWRGQNPESVFFFFKIPFMALQVRCCTVPPGTRQPAGWEVLYDKYIPKFES